jgi:uncharacterized protein (TIGR03435 family)
MMKRILLAAALLLPSQSTAQAPNPELRFEVAAITSVADVPSGARIGIDDTPAAVRIENLTLRALLRIGYGVMDELISGPGWLNEATFNITAKPPAGYQQAQLPVLVRNLLADRFGLVVHREKRDVAGFALRVNDGGHRLVAATGQRSFLTGRDGLISGNGRSLAEIVPILAEKVRAPVVNETGLSGAFDIKLAWTPQLNAGINPGEPDISLFTALREQLGLRLESVRVPVDAVVVDRIARVPTEN